MVHRVKANPELIKWARKDAGYKIEELPKYLENAQKWESGELQPTWNDLRNLAKKYKRPPIFYFMSEPPKEEDNQIIEFRANALKEYSPELKLEIRKAKYRRNAFINLNAEMGLNLPTFSNNKIHENNPSIFAKKVREFLNVPIESQRKWIFNENGNRKYDHSIFLYNWKEIIHNLGILVFETEDVLEEEMSGLSLYYDTCPIILLNGKNYHNRRIFTLIHELSHILMGQSTICDVDKHNKKESFCSKVAAKVLVPLPLDDEQIFTKKGSPKFSHLSHTYGVSKQTIVLRLYHLNKISKELKDSTIKELELYNQTQKKKKRKYEYSQRKKGGGMPPEIKKIKYEGKPYSRLMVSAYENKIISPVTFSRYMDLQVTHIDKLIEKIY